MSNKSLLPLVGASVLLMFAVSLQAEQRILKGDEIKTLLSGATMSGLNSRGKEWVADFSPDGTFKIEVSSVNWSDTGTWDVEDDKYCSERTKRSHKCQTISHVEGDNYLLEDERGEGMKIKISK